MFAKKLSRNCKKWAILQKLNNGVKNISTASCNKNKFHQQNVTRRKNFFFHDKFTLKVNNPREIHTSVKSMSLEIDYAHNVLQSSKAYPNCLVNSLATKHVNITEVQQLIDKNWVAMSNEKLLENFEQMSLLIQKNEESVDDFKYKTIIKILTIKCRCFSFEELIHLLSCLELCSSKTKKPMSPAIYDMAIVIDQEFMSRLKSLSVDQIFLINDYFYRLNFFKLSRFSIQSLKSLNFNCLNPGNLVHLMFFMKVHKKLSIPLNALEHYLWRYFDKYTFEELGIIAMAFFKNETQIKDNQYLVKIMQKLTNNINAVDDVTFVALLKILRYSTNLKSLEQFITLLESLVSQIPHRKLQTITHIAHVQASSIIHNKKVISKILERYEKELSQARLKDIERIAFVLYTFNYDPKTTPLYSNIAKELMSSCRVSEIDIYPKSFAYTLMYMTQINYYAEDALAFCMSPSFIKKISQDNLYNLGREYLIIDNCIEIDHPEYRGQRLNHDVQEHVKKYGVFYGNSKSWITKANRATKLAIEISHIFKKILGSESLVHTDYLLPHVVKDYIILCYDQETEKYVPPAEQLSQIPLGSIKYAPKDGKKWFAIIIGSHNLLTRDSVSPTGLLAMQMRQLKRIGYIPILIKYNEWKSFTSDRAKTAFLSSILSNR